MSTKNKEHRSVCRLVVVKIVDSGPIASDKTESDINEEPVIRHSPQQKRPVSPVSTANVINNKKVKLEQPINNIKKKQVQQSMINKTTVNNKKTKLISYKSSSVLEEKISKNLPIKELNQTVTINENSENPSLSKSRTSIKLTKSQSTNDIRSSVPSTITNTKKKESVPSPPKSKSVTNSQTVLKKPINKNLQKTVIKTEPSSTSIIKSPLNVIIKKESSPQSSSSSLITPSNNTTTSVSISNLKKIPKKPVPPKIEEKRSRSLIPSSSLNRNSIRDSQKQQSLSSKTQTNLKRDHSLSSVNNSNSNDRSRKTKIIKDRSDHSINQSSNSSRNDQLNHQKRPISTPPKSSRSPSQPHIDPPINSTVSSSIDTSQPSISNSPSTHVFQNEDNHIQTPMDIDRQNNDDHIQLSDKSNSPHEQILIQSTEIPLNRISYSDQSDANDSDISIEDDNEEQDLPTSLTNDDLRYKLIYIYKRFQLNLINDLIIFVRFFKRNQLIDISSLSMTKTTNEMFTYDLFSLSPSHIGELANDLGYTTMNIINSME